MEVKRDKTDFCVFSLGEWVGGSPIHCLFLLFGSVGSVSYKEPDGPPDCSWLEKELGLKCIFGEARNLRRGSISPQYRMQSQL